MIHRLLPFIDSIPPIITLIAGFIALLAGGYWLVEGAVRLARRLGQSTLMIGLTVVAFGTSAPELAFNVTAAVKDSTALCFGNVVGSNIANIALVLGLSSLVRPLVVHSRIIRRELPILIGVTVLSIALAYWPATRSDGGNPAFTFLDGIAMLILFTAVAWQWVRAGSTQRDDPYAEELKEDTSAPVSSIGAAIGLLVLGLAVLVIGADMAEIGATGVARGLGISDAVIGLTIVAFATSLPEIVTSVVAARKGHGDLAVGNVIGSNLFNLCLVLGTTCAVAPPVAIPPYGGWDLLVMLGLTIALVPIAITNRGRIVALEGAFLVACYVGYVVFTVVR